MLQILLLITADAAANTTADTDAKTTSSRAADAAACVPTYSPKP